MEEFSNKKAASGRPVMIERIGKGDFAALSKSAKAKDSALRSYLMYIEETWRMVRETKDNYYYC